MQQQLSFLDPPHQQGAVPVWASLDDDQRIQLVLRLARLITRATTLGDHDNERAKQDHR